MNSGRAQHPDRRRKAAFTLTELLVVMAVIAVLSTLTLVSIRTVARNARLASATNTLTAVLSNARALALKRNTNVLVVFRPRVESTTEVAVDLVLAEWTGESLRFNHVITVDRFVPLADIPVRSLPAGIKIAGPMYAPQPFDTTDAFAAGAITDFIWETQAHLPAVETLNEMPGRMLAVMYAADGTTITQNVKSGSTRMFVDFNHDNAQKWGNQAADPAGYRYDRVNPADVPSDEVFFDLMHNQYLSDDEPFVRVVPFLAVYDDDEARERRTNDWTMPAGYRQDLTGDGTAVFPGYITESANRIHFNRYTGVALK